MKGKTIASTVYLVIFALVTLALTYVLAVTITNGSVAHTVSYRAEFTDTEGLLPGDDVRVAGVRVGQVKKVHLQQGCGTVPACSVVTFGLAKDIPLESNAEIDVRYRNLVGQRYLDVIQTPGVSWPMAAGSLVPFAQTRPPLDLTVLFDGFKPLFQALDPEETNQVAYEIVATLQGEGGNLDALLSNTGTLTTTVAAQDSAIGSLIDNLSGVLATVDDRDGELTGLIDQLQRLVTGLAGDRDAIAGSLSNVDRLATSTTQLIGAIRPYLPTDLSQLSGVANTLATTTTVNASGQRQNQLDEFVNRFPGKLNTITRTATYGGFFNFYLCRVNATLGTLPAGLPSTVSITNNNSQVCQTAGPVTKK